MVFKQFPIPKLSLLSLNSVFHSFNQGTKESLSHPRRKRVGRPFPESGVGELTDRILLPLFLVIIQNGCEALSREAFRNRQIRQFAQGGIDPRVPPMPRSSSPLLSCLGSKRSMALWWLSRNWSPFPNPHISQMPTVITPDHNHRLISNTRLLQSIEHRQSAHRS